MERRWFGRMTVEPRLATLVTAEGARREPIHRWLPYRQGFSPALVRLFLDENKLTRSAAAYPVLDPFSGAGTCIVECARRGVHAIGVEAMASLTFLSNAKFERQWTPLPEWPDSPQWEAVAERLEAPIHRAALMLAQRRRHTSDGRPNRGAKPIRETLGDVSAMIQDDLRHPLPLAQHVETGDARNMNGLADGSIAGVLTSPPYLSRYDYKTIVDPIDHVFRYWYPDDSSPKAGSRSVRAEIRQRESRRTTGLPNRLKDPREMPVVTDSPTMLPDDALGQGGTSAIVREIESALDRAGLPRQSGLLRDYFHDMTLVLDECRRVLRSSATAWFIVGGARIKNVYVPSDLIVAELAESLGLHVSAIRVSRDLTPTRRKLGASGHVAPRESLIVMHKP